MLSHLIQTYATKKAIIRYFFLTYLDKIISFALPLSILFVLKDRPLYNLIEVVISYSTIALAIVELGLTNYLFWGYKNAGDKNSFIKGAEACFRFVIFGYVIITVVALTILNFNDNYQLLLLMVLVSSRTLFTFFVNFYSNVFRLKDNPARVYLISITANISSLILLALAFFFSWSNSVIYFFLPNIILLIVVSVLYVKELKISLWKDFTTFIAKAIQFAWPIMLNTLIMGFMNNYAKIYAYANLSQTEMTQISYVLRITLIIQLTHLSFSSFYSKSIFMDSDRGFNLRMFKQYATLILLSGIGVVLIVLSTNFLFGFFIQIPLNIATFLFIAYIIVWCFTAYLEIYFGAMNANRNILYNSIAAATLYLVLLKISGNVTLFQLSVFMVVSALLNLTLVILALRRLGVLTLKRK